MESDAIISAIAKIKSTMVDMVFSTKKISVDAHHVLLYRPASLTEEQAKFWTPIEKRVGQLATSYTVAMECQSKAMHILTLVGDAAELAARWYDDGVPLSVDSFNFRMKEYCEIAKTCETQFSFMTDNVMEIIQVMPRLDSVRKRDQLYEAMKEAQRAVLKAECASFTLERKNDASLVFEEAKQAYYENTKHTKDLVHATGVHQDHVVSFLKQVQEVTEHHLTLTMAAVKLADNATLLGEFLKQVFQLPVVEPVKEVTDALSAIKLHGQKLIPFQQVIVEEFKITDKACCCNFNEDNMKAMSQRLRTYAEDNKLRWNLALDHQFKKLCRGELFQPSLEEACRYKYAMQDCDARARLIVENLKHISAYIKALKNEETSI